MERKLKMVFKAADGSNVTFTYSYISSELTQTEVTNVMNALIANGSIFKVPPVTKVSAVVVITTEEAFAVA